MALLMGCADSKSSEATEQTPASTSASAPTPDAAIQLVVLGDSIAKGNACPGCTLYPEQVAAAMEESLGRDVEVRNLAFDGAEVANLLDAVRNESAMRASISDAEAIIVTVGHNDLAYNRLDDPCGVAPDYPRVSWSRLTHDCIDEATDEYRRDLDDVLAEIDDLRAGRPTMLRVTNVYNSTIGDLVDPTWDSPKAIEPSSYAVQRMVRAQCEIASQHDGVCLSTYHPLNGVDGLESAQPFLNPGDATHLAQPGHDAFAEALVAAGFSPLEP